jgi:EAL domain-containing protein (putative c-di-GMP-specific phosphodiesterase class I)
VERLWFLESIAADGSHANHEITKLPFHIGRGSANDLVLDSSLLALSRQHAVLAEDIIGRLRLTDLNSTNGSFVNHQRIEGSRLLNENDVIHFGTAEFQLRRHPPEPLRFAEASELMGGTVLVPVDLALSGKFEEERIFFEQKCAFLELLKGHGISGAAQPIVDARSSKVCAYELLGRVNHSPLPNSPIKLFALATTLKLEVELSVAFRKFGMAAFAPRLQGFPLFINTHPKETFSEELIGSLVRFRRQMPDLDLVIEIHESAVTDSKRLIDLAARLRDICVRFAYDDFGAGQARLNELSEAPAHFVKFDMGLLHDIHKAIPRKRSLVRDLVKMVLDIGSVPLAEGIEKEEEAVICREMGFQLIQGFFTGRPIPLENLAQASSPPLPRVR